MVNTPLGDNLLDPGDEQFESQGDVALGAGSKKKKSALDSIREAPKWVQIAVPVALGLVLLAVVSWMFLGGDKKKPRRPLPASSMAQRPALDDEEETAEGEGVEQVGDPAAPESPADMEAETEPGERPEDVAEWKRDDYFGARAENDPKLIEAVGHLGERFAGDPQRAPAAVGLLKSLLAPPAPEEPSAEETTERSGASRRRPVRRGHGSSNDLITSVVQALHANGSEAAHQVMRELLAGSVAAEDDQSAVAAVMEVMGENPSPEYEVILLQAVTRPEQLRPAGRGDVTAEQLRQDAIKLLQSTASASLRTEVAKFLTLPTTPHQWREPLGKFLETPEPVNLGAQMVLFASGEVDEQLKKRLVDQFTAASSDALKKMMDIPEVSASGSRGGRGSTRMSTRSRSGDEEDPNLPFVMAQRLWNNQAAGAFAGRAAMTNSLETDAPLVVLASTIPVDMVRHTVFRTLNRHWQQGPEALESAGWGKNIVTDPGLLVTLKLMPRAWPKDSSATTRRGSSRSTSKNRSNRSQRTRSGLSDAAKKAEDELKAKEAWMEASANTVQQWCDMLHAAALAQAEAARLAGRRPNEGHAIGRLRQTEFEIHDAAEVAAEYYLAWGGKSDKLPEVNLGPLAVCYVRIEENNASLKTRRGYYRRQLRLREDYESKEGIWMDYIRAVPDTRRQRSIDVLITQVDSNKDRDSDEPEELIIEILSVELNDPSGV